MYSFEPFVRTFVATYARGTIIQEHRHSYDQLVYTTRGVLNVRTGNGTWVTPVDRAVWVPANVTHELKAVERVQLTTLYFKTGLSKQMSKNCHVLGMTPLLRELIRHVTSTGAIDWENLRHRRLVLVILDQLAELPVEPLELPYPTDSDARDVAISIAEDPGSRALVSGFLVGTPAAQRTIERRFLQETGLTLGRWRQRARLMKALELLAQGESVARTADRIGYGSPSAFITMFKRLMGLTPADYFRKSIHSNSGK